jgi:hypothetical protein
LSSASAATLRLLPSSACGWTSTLKNNPTSKYCRAQGMIRHQLEFLSSARLQNRCEATNGTIPRLSATPLLC